jgi:RecJ-like exonuclease
MPRSFVLSFLYQWPTYVSELCPHCRGGGEPKGKNYCYKCKGKGEVPMKCECGELATEILNDEAMCRECKEIKESENE